jgi:hypothetical protein
VLLPPCFISCIESFCSLDGLLGVLYSAAGFDMALGYSRGVKALMVMVSS